MAENTTNTAVMFTNPVLSIPTLGVGAEQMREAVDQLRTVREFILRELKDGLDFGKVPGCGDKPTLLQPGAQKLCMLFNVYPEYDVQRIDLDGGHVDYIVKTSLYSRVSGTKVGAGVGSCCTMEKKYRYRMQNRVCPRCGKDTIRTSKTGGYYCWAKIGGCGAQYGANDNSVATQMVGLTENEDIADSFNTVLKIAKKRSFVDASLSLSCVSEFFTQDLEDNAEVQPHAEKSLDTKPEEPAVQVDWRDHPQVREYNETFDKLMNESNTLGSEREASCRAFVKSQWIKFCQQEAVEPRPDRIDAEHFSKCLGLWRDSVHGAFEERKKQPQPQRGRRAEKPVATELN